jgi:hypothetical protein
VTWVKLDDQSWAHPKVVAAGFAAWGLNCRAMCWCASLETDGFVPRLILNQFGARSSRLADKLVTVGLWEDDAERDGWKIHDFLDYNPSRAENAQRRTTEAKRKARMRASKASVSRWDKDRTTEPGKEPADEMSRRDKDRTAERVPDLSRLPDPARPDPISESESRDARGEDLTPASPVQEARALLSEWAESKTPRPLVPRGEKLAALLGRIASALDAGWQRHELFETLDALKHLSAGWLDTELQQQLPARANGHAGIAPRPLLTPLEVLRRRVEDASKSADDLDRQVAREALDLYILEHERQGA